MNTSDAPSFSLGLTQDPLWVRDSYVTQVANNEKAILSPDPISVCPPKDQREGKRQTTITDIMKSPFVPRIVDIDLAYTTEESKLTKYLFRMTAYDMG